MYVNNCVDDSNNCDMYIDDVTVSAHIDRNVERDLNISIVNKTIYDGDDIETVSKESNDESLDEIIIEENDVSIINDDRITENADMISENK